nr:hypothetical protein [Clostridium perfringens]
MYKHVYQYLTKYVNEIRFKSINSNYSITMDGTTYGAEEIALLPI